jgi:cell division septation protein DedD
VRKYPESEAELKAVYRLGIIYSRLDDLEKAKAAYNYIIQSYPMSLEASFAKDKLKNLSNSKGKKPLKEKIANSYAPPADNEDSKKSPAKKHNEPKQSTLTQTNNKVKLTLHIGNYRAKYRGYVRLLLKRLKRNGFKAYIKKRKINGRWYYTLRVGSFENKNKAMKRAYVIKKKLRLRVRIVGKT